MSRQVEDGVGGVVGGLELPGHVINCFQVDEQQCMSYLKCPMKKNDICDVLAHNLDALDWLVWNESFLGKWTKLWSDFEYEAYCLL